MNTQTMNLHETKAFLLRALAYVEHCEIVNQQLASKQVDEDLNKHFVSNVGASETAPLVDKIMTDAKYIQRCLTKADLAFKFALESWIYNAEIEGGLTELAKAAHPRTDGKLTGVAGDFGD